uniref:Terpene synthase 5 n=1 Tax=Copaifera officinalis TaxID=327148 RepID=U3ML17_9FABA|nr:terpene synthase 5 [Copaifera officinalis]
MNYEIQMRVDAVKAMWESIEDGWLNISAYDTAWVALVEDINGSGSPQFPSCLQWIVENQLPDGSWGDRAVFLSYDRLLSTLACVVALRHWNVHPEKSKRGIEFFKENLERLAKEDPANMSVGFEMIFPSLIEMARDLNIEVPDPNTHPILKQIYAMKNEKLKRIPMEVVHKMPTSLLFSLEAMPGLQWDKLLKLQSENGSFLSSPASTAFALMQTKDKNCLRYLNDVVQKFSGAVPNFYSIEFFEQSWAIDRLTRLGISRYFGEKIKESMNFFYKNWKNTGLGWNRYTCDVPDLDDTIMAFRLLRLHGYDISCDVLKHFETDGEFFCMVGQSSEAVTAMFNLFRASQVSFPGEKIMEDAKRFSCEFLTEKRAANQLGDKWVIAKDIAGEIGFSLDLPWYGILPRIETRFYLDQYGGANDVWIAKVLYRLLRVNNEIYLELGKLDYNNCQALHRTEWAAVQEWYSESGLDQFGLDRDRLLVLFFLASSSVFEPERARERLAWVKTSALMEAITSTYNHQRLRSAFVHEFTNATATSLRSSKVNERSPGLVNTLMKTLHDISLSTSTAHYGTLQKMWKKWLLRWESEGDDCEGGAELLANMININAGYFLSRKLQLNPEYQRLVQLTNQLCHRLQSLQNSKEPASSNNSNKTGLSDPEIESKMQELVQLVLLNSSNGIDSNIKKTFLALTKTFYYAAYCDSKTIDTHIAKVLFERVN